ncbi:hypothetical protein PYW08_009997 [Mythimna loreyi]|uniref:Uncharacterized protein n=1 Tax=Mythimna loreyi TaxID=667449 RepID=A0ACC2Q5C6_9NEOP|nr:hypothetical protein PYW08_009997 [Mythimna loreyi]
MRAYTKLLISINYNCGKHRENSQNTNTNTHSWWRVEKGNKTFSLEWSAVRYTRLPKNKTHQPMMDFKSFAWCKPDWCLPSMSQETNELLRQCADLPEEEASDDVDELIARSKAFPIPFPIETVRLEKLKEHRPLERLKQNMVSTYPLVHERVLRLMMHFLIYKREFGSSIEKELYRDMTVPQLIDRILTKRAVVFLGEQDSYMLLTGQEDYDGWESVGTVDQRPPLLLENCLSYDEMKISALVCVSGHTECINDGNRFNSGCVKEEDIETHAVIIGAIGPRFERPFRMDCEDILVTEDGDGYSKLARPALQAWRQMWADFYQVPIYTYKELADMSMGDNKDPASKYTDRFVKLSKSGHVFDNEVYYKRISVLAETVLIEADARAREADKMAYVNVIGCGLGVWRVSRHQEDVYVLSIAERVQYLLQRDLLQHVSTVNFAYITPSDSVLAMFSNSSDSGSKAVHSTFFEHKRHPEGGIKVQIQKREPSAKLTGEDEGKLLVMTYPWDGNAHPGNEFWRGALCDSGDPAAACSTQVSELHNAHINRGLRAPRTRVAAATGLHALREHCNCRLPATSCITKKIDIGHLDCKAIYQELCSHQQGELDNLLGTMRRGMKSQRKTLRSWLKQ